MSDLTDILRDALGCTPGARGCLIHGHGWPCDVLVDAESRVQAHVERAANVAFLAGVASHARKSLSGGAA